MSANRTAAGSTRGWRKLRAYFAEKLPLPCAICGLPVEPDPPGTLPGQTRWHVHHHGTPFSAGGTEADCWPAHKLCNLQAGNRPVSTVYIDPTMESTP